MIWSYGRGWRGLAGVGLWNCVELYGIGPAGAAVFEKVHQLWWFREDLRFAFGLGSKWLPRKWDDPHTQITRILAFHGLKSWSFGPWNKACHVNFVIQDIKCIIPTGPLQNAFPGSSYALLRCGDHWVPVQRQDQPVPSPEMMADFAITMIWLLLKLNQIIGGL